MAKSTSPKHATPVLSGAKQLIKERILAKMQRKQQVNEQMRKQPHYQRILPYQVPAPQQYYPQEITMAMAQAYFEQYLMATSESGKTTPGAELDWMSMLQ